MREIRTSGSEGGGTDSGPPYPYPASHLKHVLDIDEIILRHTAK